MTPTERLRELLDERGVINLADCEQTGWVVKKFDSPDNPSSWMPTGCRYETEVDDGRVRG